MSVEIPEIHDEELRSEVTLEAATATLALVGSADTRVMAALDDLLKKVHQSVVARSYKEIVVDFRQLEFMNSSCFKAFVSWITAVKDLESDKQYKIRFLSDENKHWQRRSLGALSCFAVDLIGIEV